MAIEAEAALVGGLLIDPAQIPSILEIASPEHCARPKLRTVFEAVVRVWERTGRADKVLVFEELGRASALDILGGREKALELLTKLLGTVPTTASLLSYAKLVLGAALRRQAYSAIHIAPAGVDAGEDLGAHLRAFRDLANQLERLEPGGAAVRGNNAEAGAPGFVTLADLQNEPEEEESWLVEGLLPTSGTSMIVAKPKVGKSVTAQNLALCIARGEPFLGRQTVSGPVLYLALEEKRSEIRRHFEAMGAQPRDGNLFFYIAPSPDDALEWLAREAKQRKPVLIIIDTLQRLLRIHDLNDYGQVTIKMEPLVNLSRENGAHLLLAHHAKKSGGSDGDAVLGSTGLFGSIDTLLEMRRSESARTIKSTQRYGKDLEETVLSMDPGTLRITVAGSRADFDEERAAEAILDHLGGQPEPLDRHSIIESVEGRAQVKHGALKRLIKTGRIDQSGSGKKGDPYRYKLCGSLVPDTYRELPEPRSEDAESASEIRPDSSSRDVGESGDAGTTIRGTGNYLFCDVQRHRRP